MHRKLLILALSALLPLSQAATVDVRVGNNFFNPATVRIKTGDTVRWIFDRSGHDVTSQNGTFNSARPVPVGETFSHTFNTAGSFGYFCFPHRSIGMTGSVIVTNSAANQLPTVSISSPANNSTFTTAQTVTIQATATDTDGTISKVEFFDGAALLGTDTVAPYSFAGTFSQGNHSLTAKATDNANGVTTSAAVQIVVNPPANQPPTVAITSPGNNSTFTTAQQVTIEATANDPDGSITKVEFFDGANLIGTDTVAPYAFAGAFAQGTHTLTAKATDNANVSTTSGQVTIVVNAPANQPPTATLSSPSAGKIVLIDEPVAFSATANDPDGALARVELRIGTQVLATDLAAPYAFSTVLPAGLNSVIAVAIDNLGAEGASTAVQITAVRRPKIESIEKISATEVRLTLSGSAGADHVLQSSPALVPANWTDVGNPFRFARGNVTTTAPINSSTKFFRIVVP